MKNKLMIFFAIIVIACLVFICFNMYQINIKLSEDMEDIKSEVSQISSVIISIKKKYVGTGFSLTPFNY